MAGQRARNLEILFADLEKNFIRATSRAQGDTIQLKNFRKSAFACCATVNIIVMNCALVNRIYLANTFQLFFRGQRPTK